MIIFMVSHVKMTMEFWKTSFGNKSSRIVMGYYFEKKKTIKKAYKNYSFNEIAKFDECDIKRILNDKELLE